MKNFFTILAVFGILAIYFFLVVIMFILAESIDDFENEYEWVKQVDFLNLNATLPAFLNIIVIEACGEIYNKLS